MTVTADNRIKTLEQLKAAVNLDETEWVVVDSGFKKWDGFAKDKEGELHWHDGKLQHGDLYYNGVSISELFSVWMKCVRREPVPLYPTLSKVSVNVAPGALSASSQASPSALVLADMHVGFERDIMSGALTPMHDRSFMACMLKVAETVRPIEVHILGDGLDLAAFSTFTQKPQHAYTLQPALYELAWFLARLRYVLPHGSSIFYHKGNHEERIDKDLAKSMPELYGIRAVGVDLPALSLESLLDLGSINVQWVGDYPNSFRMFGDVMLKHGDVAKQPGLTARHYAENEVVSTVTAHIHREELATSVVQTPAGRKEIKAYTVGCGCDLHGAVPARKKHNNWTQGAILIHNGAWSSVVQHLPVVNGTYILNGRKYICQSYIEDLEKDITEIRWR